MSNSHVLLSWRFHEPIYFYFTVPANSGQSQHPYLITDVTGSLYYHESKNKMVDINEDELSDSSGNLSVVSDEDFEVSSSSKDSVTANSDLK